MNEFIKICSKDDLFNGKGRSFEIEDEEIAVFMIDDEIFVLSNLCSHQHAPVISEGMIYDYKVTCPRHGWIFDLKSGKSCSGQSPIRKYEYKIENNDIYVKKRKSLF